MCDDGLAPRSTRERILDVAFDLFVEVGFAGTTVREIERRAGLASGTGSFHRHFASKDALLPAAVEREMRRALMAVRTEFPVGGSPLEQRDRWLDQVKAYINRFDRLIRLLIIDGERVPEVRVAIQSALQGMSETISWERDPTAIVGVAALHGYLLLSRAIGEPFYGVSEDAFVRMLAEVGLVHPADSRDLRPGP